MKFVAIVTLLAALACSGTSPQFDAKSAQRFCDDARQTPEAVPPALDKFCDDVDAVLANDAGAGEGGAGE